MYISNERTGLSNDTQIISLVVNKNQFLTQYLFFVLFQLLFFLFIFNFFFFQNILKSSTRNVVNISILKQKDRKRREVVKTTVLQQDPPNHKIDSLYQHPPPLPNPSSSSAVKMTMTFNPHFSCLSSNADSC